jgi:hypothetical protein
MGLFGNKTPKEEPLYKSSYMTFWVNVYSNRVEFRSSSGYGSVSVPIQQIASVTTSMFTMHLNIETTGGKKYTIPTFKLKELQQAIYDAQAKYNGSNNNQSNNGNVADEITKLNDLKEKGILTQEEFDKKKKQILGI